MIRSGLLLTRRYGRRIVFSGGSLLLDQYPGAAAAYSSSRLLSTSYFGQPLIRVRRSYPTITGDTSTGSNTIQNASSVANVRSGITPALPISGAGIPAGATVVSFTATTITFSGTPATAATSGVTLTLGNDELNISHVVTPVSGEYPLDETALLAFTSATSGSQGFVTICYGQNAANNATQSVAASQPQIVLSGATVKENTRAVLAFDNANYFFNIASPLTLTNSLSTQFLVARKTGGGAKTMTSGDTGSLQFRFDATSATLLRSNQAPLVSATAANGFRQIAANTGAGGNTVWVDGVTTTSATFAAITTPTMFVGKSSAGEFFDSNMAEIIYFTQDRASDVTAINANQKAFYGTA